MKELGRIAAVLIWAAMSGVADARGSALREYPVPTSNAGLGDICSGPDGNLWFTESKYGHDGVGRITLDGVITEFRTNYLQPVGITAGPDGRIWFTGFLYGYIGRMETDGRYAYFACTNRPGDTSPRPRGIAAGPDGALWYVMEEPSRIGRISVDGAVTEFFLADYYASPSQIAAGPDARLWFTEAGGAPAIGAINQQGEIVEYRLPIRVEPADIALGPDRNLWFSAAAPEGPAVWRITVAGALTRFPMPGAAFSPGPEGIVSGPDGALWVCEGSRNAIARMTVDGRVQEYFLPEPGRGPHAITLGSDNALWFTERGNQIGRLDPNVFADRVAGIPASGTNGLGLLAIAIGVLGSALLGLSR